MRAVREGDVYFVTSPFHSEDVDTAQEKRLSYLVGTISERPVVVIRGPEWWDPFNTVTVIPALRKGFPAITFHLDDRYGFRSQAEYPFVPHLSDTIPVSRLGRYIGSLDKNELDELVYAHKWINDRTMRSNSEKYHVPSVYRKVMEDPRPHGSWRANRDARSQVILNITREGTIKSETHPELNGFPLEKITKEIPITRQAEDAITDEGMFIRTEEPLPDSVPAPANTTVVPVEKKFPPSLFDEETLRRVAGNFSLSDAYYTDRKPRDPVVLNEEESSMIRGGMSLFEFDYILDYYKKMSVMDAILLGPRLPIRVLAEIIDMPISKAVVLKRLCNIMRDMPEVKYQRRMEERNNPKPAAVEEKTEEDQRTEEQKPVVMTREIQAAMRAYMNPKSIMTMPDDIARAFMYTPKYVVKSVWKGPQFKTKYEEARAFYANKLALQ